MSLAAINKVRSLKRERKRRKNTKKNRISKAKKLAYYDDKPIEFLQEKLGIELLTEEQQEICISIRDNLTTNVQAAHGVGKCLAQNEPVLLANGLEVKASELIGLDFNLLTLDNGNIRVVKAKAGWNQVEEVYEVTTETGRKIIRNAKHPLWAGIKWSRDRAHPIIDVREWTAIDQINSWIDSPPEDISSKFSQKNWNIKNDRKHSVVCAVPEEIPVFGDKSLPEHEIKIMAYLIGDGGLTTTTPVFTQQDNKQLAEFKQCVETMGCVLSRRSDISYAVINPIENRYFPKQKPISRALHELKDFSCDRHISTKKAIEIFEEKYQGTVTEQVNIQLLKKQKNSAIRIVEARQGVEPGKCRDFITRHKVKKLLKDHNLLEKGSANKIIPDAIFQLPKKQLAIFLSRLFSTDGWACVSNPYKNRKNGKAEIGFCSISRQLIEQIQRLLLRFGIVANINQKPKVNAWVLSIHKAEMILKFADKIGIFGKEEAIRKVIETAKIANSANQKQSWRNKDAPNGTIWEKIVSIKKLDKPEPTVAIEVPGYHHFLTNFWEHNSFLMAGVILWWIFAVGGVAFSTAPTYDQVNDILWKEVRLLYDRNKKNLGGRRTELTVKTVTKEGKQVGAKGFSTRNYDSNAFQGKHDDKLLLLQDEADGITTTIDEAFDSCLSGSNNRGVRVGNPLTPGSAFEKNCQSGSIKISVWNHPNVEWAYEEVETEDGTVVHRLKSEVAEQVLKPGWEREKDPVKPQSEWSLDLPRDIIPGAVSVAWIEKTRNKYGEKSPYWASRVEANFPGDSIEGIIPLSWLKEARARYDENPDRWDKIAKLDKWRIGVDVSDGGDRHAIALWRGRVLYSVRYIQPKNDRQDTTRLANDYVIPLIKSLGGMYQVAIDNTGVGAGTLSTVRDKGYFAIGCKFGENANKKEDYVNRKIELFWNLREGLKNGTLAIAPLGKDEDEVFEELAASRYNTDTEEKLRCEPKKETVKRIKRSPDGADAVITAGEIPIAFIQTESKPTPAKDAIDKEKLDIEKLLESARNWREDISIQEANQFL